MKTLNQQADDLRRFAERMQSAHPTEILETAEGMLPRLAFACSFGAEDMVILEYLMQVKPDATVFYLDTDLLFPETYALRDKAVEKYGLPNLVRLSPDLSLEEQANLHGEALWSSDPNLCCDIRKVQPLRRMLSTLDGWITGIRRQQSPTRAGTEVFEWDAKFGLVKVNPLAHWTDEQVWACIREHDIPYNPLHDHGYPSIGCTHCTRPVAPGDDPRSGRWAGFAKTECGLHRS